MVSIICLFILSPYYMLQIFHGLIYKEIIPKVKEGISHITWMKLLWYQRHANTYFVKLQRNTMLRIPIYLYSVVTPLIYSQEILIITSELNIIILLYCYNQTIICYFYILFYIYMYNLPSITGTNFCRISIIFFYCIVCFYSKFITTTCML